MSQAAKLAALRDAMSQADVHACLIPSADPHLSEYLPEYWQIRLWLTGFTGSAGTVLVTQDFAGVWVDSRYWVQAETELAGTGFTMMKMGTSADSGHVEWLTEHLRAGQSLAIDGRALSLSARDALVTATQKCGVTLRLDLDIPGQVWLDRPALPKAPVLDFSVEYAGVGRVDKIARVRAKMQEAGAQWHLISTLDDIAWILNLRGNDVDYNPVFLSHLLISEGLTRLFIGKGKIPPPLVDELKEERVAILPYEDVAGILTGLPAADTLMFDPARTTCGLIDQIKIKTVRQINPSTFMKSQKTRHELKHVRRVMELDGAALCEFFAWFEANVNQPGQPAIDELQVDEKLLEFRAAQFGFVSPSFSTIAAFNANGAMPHYRATPESFSRIEGDGLLLIDSGGQYLGGTTDITRVVPVGQPSHEQKEDYTAVLKAMIALSRLTFPEGVASPVLDVIARAPLWAKMADYGHGTGHGVGYFLNVHEGPQAISYRAPPAPHTAMRLGMITSNEPGLYKPGRWGIRIENLVCNQSAGESEFGEFLRFETLTLCPIDTRPILLDQLDDSELDWLNSYHATVRDRLAPRLEGDALAWLMTRTTPLVV